MVLRKSFYIRWSAGRSPRVHEVNPGRDPSGAFPHSLLFSLAQTTGFSVMYFRVFIEIFEFQIYKQGHTPYQLLVNIGSYGLMRRVFLQERMFVIFQAL